MSVDPDDPRWRLCVDCRCDTIDSGQYYMVHDSVWRASGLQKEDGMLCLDCLEGRIGRWLRADDFRLTTDKRNRRRWGGCDRMFPRSWPHRRGLKASNELELHHG